MLSVLAVALLVSAASADVVISEVVDGDLAGGNPKFVELTNTGGSTVTFGLDDEVKAYFNGGVTTTSITSLDGVSILAGDSFVIASTANDGQNQFFNAYGFHADLYTPAFFGNGDDVYTLENLDVVLDEYGHVGVDGTGMVWEYTDSYAFRNPTAITQNPTFASGDWTYGGVAALDGPDDATRIALLQTYTTPGTHEFVPEPASLMLLGLGALLLRRR